MLIRRIVVTAVALALMLAPAAWASEGAVTTTAGGSVAGSTGAEGSSGAEASAGVEAAADVQVIVDGQTVAFAEGGPVIAEGRVLVPLRALFTMLGAEVQWDAASRSVLIIHGDLDVVLGIGRTTALVQAREVALDVAPVIIEGRTYVPLRFAAEALGAEVGWEAETRTVVVVTAR